MDSVSGGAETKKGTSHVAAIDIVVTTCNRLDYLQRTLGRIWECTRSPYRLWVADDGSTEGNQEYLYGLLKEKQIYGIMLRRERGGARSLLNWASAATFSDPVVFVDDDMLCPDVEPDWLSRGVQQMKRHPDLAMLALQHPGAKVKPRGQDGAVVFCLSLGATFLFIRRKFLMDNPLPHELGDLGKPLELRCEKAHSGGWKIGYLQGTYCLHFGKHSVLTGRPYGGKFIEPLDWRTLEPKRAK